MTEASVIIVSGRPADSSWVGVISSPVCRTRSRDTAGQSRVSTLHIPAQTDRLTEV